MAKTWQHLYFFDKQGKNYNMDYDSTADKWTGNIFLPQVSIDLFEANKSKSVLLDLMSCFLDAILLCFL